MSLVSTHLVGSGMRRGSTVSEHLRARKVYGAGKTSRSQLLVHTVAEFCKQIAVMYEHFAINLQSLVETFQEQTLGKDGLCGNGWFADVWEKLLDQYAFVSTDYFDLAHNLECSVINALQEATVHKHSMLDEVLCSRDNLLQEMKVIESDFTKLEKEYSEAWHKMERDGKENIKNHNTALCYNKHNDYVLQLAGVNKLNECTCATVLPSLNNEIEKAHGNISDLVIQAVTKHAQLTKSKVSEHSRHMDAIVSLMQGVNSADESLHPSEKRPAQHVFAKPDPSAKGDFVENKLLLNAATEKVLRDKHCSLLKEVDELEKSIVTGKETLTKLLKQYDTACIRANQQHTKAAELMKKIVSQRMVLQRNEVSLESKRSQLKLFTSDILTWKLSNGNSATTVDSGQATPKTDQSALSSEAKDSFSDLKYGGKRCHCFQDYNFKKPTFCDHCRGLLKGIMKQGVRCKLCKVNVHHKCQNGVTECKRVTVDKKKLLRRQKSSSELEIPRQFEANVKEVDPVYEAIKCAASLSSTPLQDTSPRPSLVPENVAQQSGSSGSPIESTNSLAPEDRDASMSKSAPHSPSISSTRRKILETYGKSMSFDTEPTSQQQHMYARSNELSSRTSSSSLSEREHVALYNFEGMMRDDLSLRTGDRVHVIDNRGSDWWKGELNGACGFFPSFCVTLVKPGEEVVRVTHTYKASQDTKDGLTLKKDQVVIQTSGEEGGWVHVSTRKQSGVFPQKYLMPAAPPPNI